MHAPRHDSPQVFLPDFCNVRTVFAVVIIGELLAFVLVLAPLDPGADRWFDLSLVSLFIQWLGLTGAAALCLSRPLLARLGDTGAGLVSYAMLLVLTVLISEAAYRVVQAFGLGIEIAPAEHLGFLLRNLTISAIINAVLLRYLYVQHQWQQQIKAESRARFDALQARIRPHFLFNTMNTIAALIRVQPEAAEEAVEDFSDLLRASLAGQRDWVRLADELALCERFLHIEQLRLGTRLQLDWALDALPGDAMIPALSIQPLLENAVYHGIEPLGGGGLITVRGARHADTLELDIDNPLPPPAAARPSGHRMAQENIRQRLAAAFGSAAELAVDETAQRYRVHLRFPYLRERP